jgi:hypothetical protein
VKSAFSDSRAKPSTSSCDQPSDGSSVTAIDPTRRDRREGLKAVIRAAVALKHGEVEEAVARRTEVIR